MQTRPVQIFDIYSKVAVYVRLKKKILFVCTEDWFFHTHFSHIGKFLLNEKNYEVILIAKQSSKSKILQKYGIRVIQLDFKRSSINIFSQIYIGIRLWKLMQSEKADILHFIAFKPIILGGFSSWFLPKPAKVYHLTGQGFFIVNKTTHSRLIRSVFLKHLARFLKTPRSWLLVENMDDLEMVRDHGRFPNRRFTILGGAGVNQDVFKLQPFPDNKILRLAFVGRLVWSKGCDVLVEALRLLGKKDILLTLDIYGEMDKDNPRSVNLNMLNEWKKDSRIRWHGQTDDIIQVWKQSDIGVFPSRGGEGMPRAMLEAASSGRPLIVTDVPGCRHFVRDGVEGLVVQPEDASALAAAIETLYHDVTMRQQMGLAARQRLLEGFTEDHVQQDILATYEVLLTDEK